MDDTYILRNGGNGSRRAGHRRSQTTKHGRGNETKNLAIPDVPEQVRSSSGDDVPFFSKLFRKAHRTTPVKPMRPATQSTTTTDAAEDVLAAQRQQHRGLSETMVAHHGVSSASVPEERQQVGIVLESKPDNVVLRVSTPEFVCISGPVSFTFDFQLYDFSTIHDLKVAFEREAHKHSGVLMKDTFVKGHVHLKGSGVRFDDDHPIYLLAQSHHHHGPSTVINHGAPPVQDVELHPWPFSTSPTVDTVIWKQGQTLKLWHRRRLKLQDGKLYVSDNATVDEVFNLFDHRLPSLDFEIQTADKLYVFQATTVEDKRLWLRELGILLSTILAPRLPVEPLSRCAICRKWLSIYRPGSTCVTCNHEFCKEHYDSTWAMCVTDAAGALTHTRRFVSPPPSPVNRAFIPRGGDEDLLPQEYLAALSRSSQTHMHSSFLSLPGASNDTSSSASASSLPGLGPSVSLHSKMREEIIRRAQLLENPVPLIPAAITSAAEDFLEDYMLVTLVEARIGPALMGRVRGSGATAISVSLYFEDYNWTSEGASDLSNPRWGDRIQLSRRGDGHGIVLALFAANAFLGLCFIPVHTLEHGVEYNEWYKLERRPGKYGVDDIHGGGAVHLRIQRVVHPHVCFEPLWEQADEDAKHAPSTDSDEVKNDIGSVSLPRSKVLVTGPSGTTVTQSSDSDGGSVQVRRSITTLTRSAPPGGHGRRLAHTHAQKHKRHASDMKPKKGKLLQRFKTILHDVVGHKEDEEEDREHHHRRRLYVPAKPEEASASTMAENVDRLRRWTRLTHLSDLYWWLYDVATWRKPFSGLCLLVVYLFCVTNLTFAGFLALVPCALLIVLYMNHLSAVYGHGAGPGRRKVLTPDEVMARYSLSVPEEDDTKESSRGPRRRRIKRLNVNLSGGSRSGSGDDVFHSDTGRRLSESFVSACSGGLLRRTPSADSAAKEPEFDFTAERRKQLEDEILNFFYYTDLVCLFFEKMATIYSWQSRNHSVICMGFLTALLAVLYVIPFRMILSLIGIYYYLKPPLLYVVARLKGMGPGSDPDEFLTDRKLFLNFLKRTPHPYDGDLNVLSLVRELRKA